MKQIHKALVHHQDIYPKNVLVVPGQPERVVWIDFDVATTFSSMGNREQAYCEYEDELVSSFGEALVRSLNFIWLAGTDISTLRERTKGRGFPEIRSTIEPSNHFLRGFWPISTPVSDTL